ncbi:MAG: hypothetical protein DCF21_13940 [Leptolyngbya sp.]|jgi:DNA-binding transcriptional regulator YhcF (GntR family)|uniref:Uncharacterized protein n=1 Tax=Shackletoniella antarctica TaxID=268115 RepID=A0A2W4VNS2_9CYAN|nr:MAG: hypothetical protein DCF17_20840 [Shackletoniella antarctica]PZV13648.1 MAG: hypothetical protein DCF21_13940 [Leptolyngbya sp.]
MNSGEIDRYPVNQLPDRYSLARSAVYKRMQDVRIVPEKVGQRSYITAQQLQLMDELHRFINQGGSAAEFIEARGLRQRPGNNGSGQSGSGSDLAVNPNDFGSMMGAFAELMGRMGFGQPDPMKYFETLENAAKNGWLPSTSELAELIDLSPREIEGYGDRFSEAGFVFSRAGYRKNGEIAWKVAKRLK